MIYQQAVEEIEKHKQDIRMFWNMRKKISRNFMKCHIKQAIAKIREWRRVQELTKDLIEPSPIKRNQP